MVAPREGRVSRNDNPIMELESPKALRPARGV